MLLHVTRTKRERLYQRINRTLQRYSSDNTDDTLTTEGDGDSVGWLFTKESQDTSTKSAQNHLNYSMRSDYWSGDFFLSTSSGENGTNRYLPSVESSLDEILLDINGRDTGQWSGDDDIS